MPLALDEPPPAARLSRSPWTALLTRIAEETEFDGAVRVAGELLPVTGGRRLVVAALADALRPQFLGRVGWMFAYRNEAGAPVFAVTTGHRDARPSTPWRCT